MIAVPRGRAGTLLGRRRECARLDSLVQAAREGRSSALVLLGEPGVGKSALLEHIGKAADCRVLRVAGVETPMELAYAGLRELLSPLVGDLDRLPQPLADALGTVMGTSAGSKPDRFRVGLGALTLLSEATHERPLVCLVDDAQWLDQASVQTLTFVARRLQAEAIVLAIAAREGPADRWWTGLPQLALAGLTKPDALALLELALPGALDTRVRDRILAETRGNPLALLELSNWFEATELAFGPALTAASTLTERLERGFARQLEPLSPECRRLLLVAATDPLGDVALLRLASQQLAIGMAAIEEGETAGLVEVRDRVRFRHPLLRSVVYRQAPVDDRRLAHHLLADLTDPHADPDRRAWHRSQAAVGPDETVAAELERSAGRALEHGGMAAAAAFLERAALLTPGDDDRLRRLLAAAEAMLHAGSLDAGMKALAAAEEEPATDLQLARIDVLRAQMGFAANRGNEALPMLVAAAHRLEGLDVRLAMDSYVDALTAVLFAGRFASRPEPGEVGRAARRAPRVAQPRRSDTLLQAVAERYAGYPAAVPLLRTAAEAFDTDDLAVDEAVRFMWLAAVAASDVWDERLWDRITQHHLNIVRRAGALNALPLALNTRVYVELFSGNLSAAAALVDEAEGLTDTADGRPTPYGAIGLGAFRGEVSVAAPLLQSATADGLARGEGITFSLAHWARAVMHNGHRRPKQAFEAAQVAAAHPGDLGVNGWSLVELVDAAVSAGEPAAAAEAFDRLSTMTSACATEWALGVTARCAARLRAGEGADALHREAIERLASTSLDFETARARLSYGEWLLHRDGRRLEARDQLRAAHTALSAMGVEAFSDRARRALAVTGETVPRRRTGPSEQLTAQEAHIARLAAAGHTNPEIGAELFLSPRTVEWHLRKVFAKLGISTRRQLPNALRADR